jgi:hypothetical protein
MGTFGAPSLTAPDLLLSQMDRWFMLCRKCPRTMKLSLGEDHQTTQFVIVEIFDRVQQIAVEGHQATESGANNLVDWRRSVRVHPWGGDIRSAWFEHNE